MKKLKPTLLLLVVFLCTSSCINFIEKVHFNKDGSGTYSFILDMSGAKGFLAMMGEEVTEEKAREEMGDFAEKLDSLKMKFDGIPGITDIKSEWNFKEFQSDISFKFENVDALNKALSSLYSPKSDPNPSTEPFFVMKGGTLTRTSRASFGMDSINEMAGMGDSEGEEGMEQMAEMSKMMFRDSYAETIITFEQKVKSVSNDDYKVSDNNTLTWKKFLYDERDKDIKVPVKVKLK